MFRLVILAVVAALAVAGCHKDPPIMTPTEGELPPLPPASGTAVGYLIDNARQLQLTDDQLAKLQSIDDSLAARNDVIDTQLRQIEQPEADQPAEKGQPPPRHNNAPGAQIKSTPEAAKLHAARKANDDEALGKAFALLDPSQQDRARRLLDERGISVPPAKGGGSTPKSAP